MTLRARIMSIIAFLGILGSCYASNVPDDIQDLIKPSHELQLKDLLSTDKNLVINTAGQFKFTSSGTIRFLKAYLYPTYTAGNCTGTLLGAVSVTDNTTGFNFLSGQTISLNPLAAYKLFTNTGQGTNSNPNTADNVGCIKLYLNGGNETTNSSDCTLTNMTFQETCLAGSCNTSSNNPPTAISWAPNQTPCVAPSLYVPTSGSVAQCTFGANGTIPSCVDIGVVFSVPSSIAINNGYAYITNTSLASPSYKCVVNAADGTLNFSNCTGSGLPKEISTGIALSAGYFYLPNSNDGISYNVSYGTIDSITGALAEVSNQSASNQPYAVAINRGYAYITNKTAGTVSYCPIKTDGSLDNCLSPIPSVSVSNVQGIAISNGYAYMVRPNVITYCQIQSSGNLVGCTTVLTSIANAQGIAIYNDYVYISDAGAGSIFSCKIIPGGLNLPFSSVYTGLSGAKLMAVY